MSKKGRYAKLMGDWWRNPKRASMSAEARDLYVASLSYAADQMTDGLVPGFMVPALLCGNPVGSPVAELLAPPSGGNPFWVEHDDGYEIFGYLDHNQSRDEHETYLEKQRLNGAKGGRPTKQKNPVGSPVAPPKTKPSVRVDPRPKTQDVKTQDPKQHSESAEASSGSVNHREQIRQLEARYPNPDTLTEARASCALSRRNGAMADSVWLRTLEVMAKHPVEAVTESCQLFSAQYGDGEKDERYLLGIVRKYQPGGNNRPRLVTQTPEPKRMTAEDRKAHYAARDAAALRSLSL